MEKIKNSFQIITACAAIIFIFAVSACLGQTSAGTDFWVMFPKNHDGAGGQSLIIVSKAAAFGTVNIPGLSFSAGFSVIPGASTTVTLPKEAYAASDDGIEQRGIHVNSDNEVIVYGLSYNRYSSDAFLALPVSSLGTDYMVLSYRDGSDGPQFGVAAAYDNTLVTIVPDIATDSRAAGVPYSVVMNSGDTYQLHNYSGDLTGSVITSDKPVSVIGGNRCAVVPSTSLSCNCIVEQLPPVNSWGKRFLTMPLASRSKGDTIIFLASADDTTITVNGAAEAYLNRGGHYEMVPAGPSYVESNNPVLAAQYASSWKYDSVTFGDPSMTLVTPIDGFMTAYTVSTPQGWPAYNYLNLTMDNSGTSGIKLDGVCIPPSNFTRIGQSNFYGAQIAVGQGEHDLQADRPFGLQAYGFDRYDAYSYPGGSEMCPPVMSPTNTLSWTATPVCTNTFTVTSTPSGTGTATPTLSCTLTPSSSLTGTPTFSPSMTATPGDTITDTATITRTPAITFSSTRTATITCTVTFTLTRTRECTRTSTMTGTNTATVTLTNTSTATMTFTATMTRTPTGTHTRTATLTPTLSRTATTTLTPSVTAPATSTPSMTNTAVPAAAPTAADFCFSLKGAFPNPSRADVNIVYQLCRDAGIRAEIFSVSGEAVRVINQQGRKGFNSLYWDAKNNSGARSASGVFIYSIEAEAGPEREKLWGKVVVIK